MGSGAGVGLSGGRGVRTFCIRAPRIGVDSAAVGPCQGEQIVKIVGDAEKFLITVVRGSDGMEQKVSLGSSTDDGSVAVRSVA